MQLLLETAKNALIYQLSENIADEDNNKCVLRNLQIA